MTNEVETPIVVVHHFAAEQERVFDAFLDVHVARHFLFATPAGEMITAEVEPKVGGHFTFTERRPDMGDVRHIGQYLEIDRPGRLVFTFGVPQFDPGMTTVTIEIRPIGNGCELTLTHHGVSPDYRDGTQLGWTKILASLLPAYEDTHGGGWS